MPLYVYECNSCKTHQRIFHSMIMNKNNSICEACGVGRIFRKPLSFSVNFKQSGPQPGHLVKSVIEETKAELEQEKKNVKVFKTP